MGDHPDQRPLELADVFLHLVRDEREHVLRHQPRVGTNFGLQDGDPRFKVGRLNIGDQAPRKAGTQPVPRVGISFGGRSEEITIWRLSSCRELKVWKNSSWVRSLPARNWISSTSNTSTVR